MDKKSINPEFTRVWKSIVQSIFEVATDELDWSWMDLARHSGVSPATIYKIGYGETQLPHLYTVWRLCKAIGWSIKIASDGPVVSERKRRKKAA